MLPPAPLKETLMHVVHKNTFDIKLSGSKFTVTIVQRHSSDRLMYV